MPRRKKSKRSIDTETETNFPTLNDNGDVVSKETETVPVIPTTTSSTTTTTPTIEGGKNNAADPSASASATGAAEDCIICLETITIRGVVDSCVHPFCFNCIVKWSKVTNTCPVCKRNFLQVTEVKPDNGKGKKGKKKPKVVKIKPKPQRIEHPMPMPDLYAYDIRALFLHLTAMMWQSDEEDSDYLEDDVDSILDDGDDDPWPFRRETPSVNLNDIIENGRHVIEILDDDDDNVDDVYEVEDDGEIDVVDVDDDEGGDDDDEGGLSFWDEMRILRATRRGRATSSGTANVSAAPDNDGVELINWNDASYRRPPQSNPPQIPPSRSLRSSRSSSRGPAASSASSTLPLPRPTPPATRGLRGTSIGPRFGRSSSRETYRYSSLPTTTTPSTTTTTPTSSSSSSSSSSLTISSQNSILDEVDPSLPAPSLGRSLSSSSLPLQLSSHSSLRGELNSLPTPMPRTVSVPRSNMSRKRTEIEDQDESSNAPNTAPATRRRRDRPKLFSHYTLEEDMDEEELRVEVELEGTKRRRRK